MLSVAIFDKFAGAFLGAMMSRPGRWEAPALGTDMRARGMVETVVAMIGIPTPARYTVIAPPTLRFAMPRVKQAEEEQLCLARSYTGRKPVG